MGPDDSVAAARVPVAEAEVRVLVEHGGELCEVGSERFGVELRGRALFFGGFFGAGVRRRLPLQRLPIDRWGWRQRHAIGGARGGQKASKQSRQIASHASRSPP